MNIKQTLIFNKQKKRLHANQIKILDTAVRDIIANPTIGEQKRGDISSIRLYKFKMLQPEYLLAYQVLENSLLLHTVGVYENFYRDLKRSLK